MTRRTLTYADEPSKPIDVMLSSTPTSRVTMKRSLTLYEANLDTLSDSPLASTFSPPDVTVFPDAHDQETEDDFSILRLDLNLGATRHAKTLINHLEKASISSLLDNRLAASLDHLASLRQRIFDAHSRVLVTGDLNAGKSTLVNALLRRDEVMPTDEQPLTTRFVEVVSARENEGLEEIHVLEQGTKYSPDDPSSYTVETIDKLSSMASDVETDASSPPIRIFLKDSTTSANHPSILHNGVVDISLIDAPGLNRDSIKTTANFARQEEIDVVVFVVSAANHFTLSAKEFIWQAGHEKAHLFIVVNRFDQIKDKDRCRRLVLEQIRQLSPKTYEDAADLVHFVDSAKVTLGFADSESVDEIDEAFSHLEHSLRSFVLVNRSKSKLGPAHNYLNHLLADVELLASANVLVATNERDAARDELSRVKPELDRLRQGRDGLEDSLLSEEERVVNLAETRSKQALQRGLERVGRGELAAPAPDLDFPTYPGLLGVWDYTREVRKVLLASLDFAVSLAEQDARHLTTDGVHGIEKIGDRHLPDVERSQRVFNPNAMFSGKTSKSPRRARSVAALGLNLAGQRQLSEATLSDLFDLEHHLFRARAQLHLTSSESSLAVIPYSAEMSGFGIASLALGAFSMVGNKSLGIHSIIDTLVRLTEIASKPGVRRLAGPVAGMLAFGTVAYIIYELPRSIPRNVGRHVQTSLRVSSGSSGDDIFVPLTDAVSARVSKEVRKVMRLGSWDLRERFRGAVESRAEVVRESEEAGKRASIALNHFAETGKQVEGVRNSIADIKV